MILHIPDIRVIRECENIGAATPSADFMPTALLATLTVTNSRVPGE